MEEKHSEEKWGEVLSELISSRNERPISSCLNLIFRKIIFSFHRTELSKKACPRFLGGSAVTALHCVLGVCENNTHWQFTDPRTSLIVQHCMANE